jgi:hypothetical protein
MDDARAFGAALITVLVEEEVARKLSLAAQQQVAGWNKLCFRANYCRLPRNPIHPLKSFLKHTIPTILTYSAAPVLSLPIQPA